ncbi:MAG TPA: type II toxin-antitoxin system prevent-host-death family antitoxin [Candidatus Limnocylindria bacterium]|jgi:prevent-host-death family protein|nr:type II toxin-antitoxin system prevent-host-death family antitoxin [Candidatus Limnocylindria bacterium]
MASLSFSVPLAEAKNKLSELVERVSRGEEFVITKHDIEVARVIPARRPSRADVSDAIAKMRANRSQRIASTVEVLTWRNEGRR